MANGIGLDEDPPDLAVEVIFNNLTNGFFSTEVQSAIEEAKATASGIAARYAAVCAYGGNASTGRYLEFFDTNPSDQAPFITPDFSILRSISLVTSNTVDTGTITLYKNGVSIQAITLTAEKKKTVTGLLINFAGGDELSAKVTSGSINGPMLISLMQTT